MAYRTIGLLTKPRLAYDVTIDCIYAAAGLIKQLFYYCIWLISSYSGLYGPTKEILLFSGLRPSFFLRFRRNEPDGLFFNLLKSLPLLRRDVFRAIIFMFGAAEILLGKF